MNTPHLALKSVRKTTPKPVMVGLDPTTHAVHPERHLNAAIPSRTYDAQAQPAHTNRSETTP